jgi:hypothetical protein
MELYGRALGELMNSQKTYQVVIPQVVACLEVILRGLPPLLSPNIVYLLRQEDCRAVASYNSKYNTEWTMIKQGSILS